MLAQASASASRSGLILTDSSSDDEEYLQQVPMEKLRFVKYYKRIKSQLNAIKVKKKMILIEEKVIREEKMLIKNLIFKTLETKIEENVEERNENKIELPSTNNIEKTIEQYYDETDLLIQIQKEERANQILVQRNRNQPGVNKNDPNKQMIQPVVDKIQLDINMVQPENRIQLAQNIAETGKDKIQLDQNMDQPDNKSLKSKSKFKTSKRNKGKILYKMIDEENGYYINITKDLSVIPLFFIPIKKLLISMKPLMGEFSSFIPLELFQYVIRIICEKLISDLLVGKEKMKSYGVVSLFREMYPEDKDWYLIISALVAIWRGDYNDPVDPDDYYTKIIQQRDPQKLVSYEDVTRGKGNWEIVTIKPENVGTEDNAASIQNADVTDSDIESRNDLPIANWYEVLKLDENQSNDISPGHCGVTTEIMTQKEVNPEVVVMAKVTSNADNEVDLSHGDLTSEIAKQNEVSPDTIVYKKVT